MFEQYRTRIRRLFEKFPESLYIHYKDASGAPHCVSEDDLLLILSAAQREDRKHVIQWIDPLDLEALLAKRPIFNVLLLCDRYTPAYKVVVRDPTTGELHELSPEEQEDLEAMLDAMTEKEREAYWKDQEAAYVDHMKYPYPTKGEEA